MKLSIITPCTRVYNLPIIYKSILNHRDQFDAFEWIIVYDSDYIDEKIKVYETNKVEIKLYNSRKQDGDPYAAFIRNEGLKHVTGDLIYYLDDDNVIQPKLFSYINKYYEDDKVLIFNQVDENLKTRLPNVNVKIPQLQSGHLDTGQFVVPAKYKHIKWVDEGLYNDETPYLKELHKEIGDDGFKHINQVVTYRNYIKRNPS